MELVTFTYNKDNGEKPRTRIVLQNSADRFYLYGLDLEDNQIKTFLTSRITNFKSLTTISNSNKVELKSKDDLFELLQWSSTGINIFDALGGTPSQLANITSEKTGKKIIPLGDKFIIINNPEVNISIFSGLRKFNMVVREGVVEFMESGKKITLLEFTKRVLGI